MAISLDAVGRTTDPVDVEWTADEALLYALSVGAGQDDPLEELAFTTENSAGVDHRVLPTFGMIIAEYRGGSEFDIGDYDPGALLHAEQAVTLARPLPPAGRMTVTGQLLGIYDKGSGALVETEVRGWLPGDAQPIVVSRSSAFILGEGGFGVRGPASDWHAPEDEPDLVIACRTQPNQALVYRLLGDRNPLHSDPAFAARSGFARPILHGMCTYGVAGRVLLRALAGGRPERFVSMAGRFSRPVYPGDELRVEVWGGEPSARFRVTGRDDEVVLDRGTFTVRPD